MEGDDIARGKRVRRQGKYYRVVRHKDGTIKGLTPWSPKRKRGKSSIPALILGTLFLIIGMVTLGPFGAFIGLIIGLTAGIVIAK